MRAVRAATIAAPLALVLATSAAAGTLEGRPDSMQASNDRIDAYDARVWQSAPSNTARVTLVQTSRTPATRHPSWGRTRRRRVHGGSDHSRASWCRASRVSS
jgi:hypothetical protein